MSGYSEFERAMLAAMPPGVPIQEFQKEKLRALAWRFRQTRSCHWAGVDRVTPLLEYAELLIVSGVDRRAVLRELLCSVRCCGECE